MYVRILVCTPPLEPTDWGRVEFGRRLGGSHLGGVSTSVYSKISQLIISPAWEF